MAGIETATYVASLNALNPDANDPRSQGDDHIRLLKAVAQATFPNASRAVYFREFVTITNADSPYSVPTGKRDLVVIANSASGSITLNLGAVATLGAGTRVTVVRPSASNVVTIDGNAAETINGATTFVMDAIAYHSVTLETDGTAWYVTGEYGQIVQVGEGGTGVTTALLSIRALLNQLGTTKGNIIYFDGSNWVVLAPP